MRPQFRGVPPSLFATGLLLAAASSCPGQDDAYKRVHQQALRQILADRLQRAAAGLDAFEREHPADAETSFMRALLELRRGEDEAAQRQVRAALERGLAADRFVSQPRELLAPLLDLPLGRALAGDYTSRPVHGPMVGAVATDRARVWVRTVQPSRVRVTATAADGEHVGESRTTLAGELATVVELTGLQANTTYRYTVALDDAEPQGQPGFEFTTAPPRQARVTWSLAFGGGAGYVPEHERMWTTIAGFRPRLLLLLGDNVYSDDPTSPTMQRYCYARRQSRPEFRALVARTPTCAIWDDHDFGTNDCHGGPAIDDPEWKRAVWELFRHNWANPSYGGGEAQPGCWFSFSYGDVDVFMLDGRYYRTDPDRPDPSMLGPAQTAWLRAALRASRATFKVLCSPVPFAYGTKGNSKDTWNGFRAERAALFDFLAEQRIDGVVLLSADRHRSDAWRIERESGYALYEFNSSRLTNQHTHPEMKAALFSYNRTPSFGLVTFDTTADDPSVCYRVVTIDGEVVHELTVRHSQLRHR